MKRYGGAWEVRRWLPLISSFFPFPPPSPGCASSPSSGAASRGCSASARSRGCSQSSEKRQGGSLSQGQGLGVVGQSCGRNTRKEPPSPRDPTVPPVPLPPPLSHEEKAPPPRDPTAPPLPPLTWRTAGLLFIMVRITSGSDMRLCISGLFIICRERGSEQWAELRECNTRDRQ